MLAYLQALLLGAHGSGGGAGGVERSLFRLTASLGTLQVLLNYEGDDGGALSQVRAGRLGGWADWRTALWVETVEFRWIAWLLAHAMITCCHGAAAGLHGPLHLLPGCQARHQHDDCGHAREHAGGWADIGSGGRGSRCPCTPIFHRFMASPMHCRPWTARFPVTIPTTRPVACARGAPPLW